MPRKVPPPPLTDPGELQRFSGEHLRYEVQMFFSAAKGPPGASRIQTTAHDFTTTTPPVVLSTFTDPPWFVRMATIEAFVTHFRALVGFLFPDEYTPMPDDVAAHHFLSSGDPLEAWVAARGPLSDSLRQAKTRADKEVAHLTVKRVEGYHPDKEWHSNLASEVYVLLRTFVWVADPTRLDPSVAEYLGSLSRSDGNPTG